MKLQETIRVCFKKSKREKEGGERGAEQEQQREGREQSSKAGPYV